MLVFFVLLLGICVGSFLNVVVYRLPQGTSLLGRSFCPSCKHTLSWRDLIPLFSFFVLGKKCRYCRAPIPLGYPLVEGVTGILFAAIFLFLGLQINAVLLFWLFIASCLIAIFRIDQTQGIIPDALLILMLLVAIPFFLFVSPSFVIPHLLTGVVSFLFFLGIVGITRGRGMGFGDVKLAFVMGFLLGVPKAVVAFYAAFLTGAIVSLILIIAKRKRLRDPIAFGPFLVVGFWIGFFVSNALKGILPL